MQAKKVNWVVASWLRTNSALDRPIFVIPNRLFHSPRPSLHACVRVRVLGEDYSSRDIVTESCFSSFFFLKEKLPSPSPYSWVARDWIGPGEWGEGKPTVCNNSGEPRAQYDRWGQVRGIATTPLHPPTKRISKEQTVFSRDEPPTVGY